MNQGCETYLAAIPGLLDASLSEEAAQRLQTHLDVCNSCRLDFESLRTLEQALFALGDGVAATTGPVELWAAVASTVSNVRDEEELLYAYVEQSLDEVARARYQKRVEREPDMEQEIASLTEVHEKLVQLGACSHPASSEIDIVAAVTARAEGLGEKDRIASDEISVLSAALESIGDAFAATVPPVNLVEEIRTRIAQTSNADAHVVPFRTRPKPYAKETARRTGLPLLRWAAAAAVVLGIALVTWRAMRPELLERTMLGKNQPETRFDRVTPPEIDALPNWPAPPLPRTRTSAPSASEKSGAELRLQDAMEARQAASQNDADALQRLARWATLTPQEARDLLDRSGLSPQAIMGAAEFLPRADAISILEALLEGNPNDPALRYALARNYLASETTWAQGQAQLAQWEQLDPNNALPHYMEARLLLAQGDLDGALAVMQRAGEYDGAQAYALEAARHREQVLIAAGLDPDTARYLAAVTAGGGEYHDLMQLGNQLLYYGDYYRLQGDYALAQQIYTAVQSMGLQITRGAQMSQEQQAGLDLQREVIVALEDLLTMLDSPELSEQLDASVSVLLEGLQQFTDLMYGIDEIFAGSDVNYINFITQMILEAGDLLLF